MPDGSRTCPSPARRDLDRLAGMYREHYGFIARLLRRCGVPESDLDDAAQETFVVAYRRLADFEGRAKDRTWLYAIAVRVASTLRRSRRRESARRATAGADVHGTLEIDPEAELSRAQASAVLDDLLAELDANKRTVFVLAELEGLKAAEISRIVGLNVHTVYSRLRLARRSFDAAVKRLHAREAGRLERSQFRLRPLADRAEPARPPRRAAMAALVAHIKSGATPTVPGWEALSVAAPPSSAVLLPVATAIGLGAAGLVTVRVVSHDADPVAAPATVTQPTTPATERPVDDAPARVPAPVVAPVPAEPAPRVMPSVVVTVPPATPPPPRPPAAAQPSAEESFAKELALIERARVALRRHDPAEAIAALDEHARSFARGQLRTERDHTRIKALCVQGDVSGATALANRLAGDDDDDASLRVLATCPAP